MQQADLVHSTGLIPGTQIRIGVLIERPRLTLTAEARATVEAEVERLIELLDAADGDPDVEYDGDEFEDAEGDYSGNSWMTTGSFAPPGSCDDDEDEEYGAPEPWLEQAA